MAHTVFENIDAVRAAVGQHLGFSDWFEVTQERIDFFTDATHAYQWIHVDSDRAKAGPYGGPISHGYLTLALSNHLLPQIVEVHGTSAGVNYGVNQNY